MASPFFASAAGAALGVAGVAILRESGGWLRDARFGEYTPRYLAQGVGTGAPRGWLDLLSGAQPDYRVAGDGEAEEPTAGPDPT